MKDSIQTQELCILLEALLALLETGNNEKAKQVISNAIARIDRCDTNQCKG